MADDAQRRRGSSNFWRSPLRELIGAIDQAKSLIVKTICNGLERQPGISERDSD